jgi:peptidyl-prolyl cis-trans isomerase C
MKKVLLITAAAAVLLTGALTLSGCGGCGYDEEKPIATIGGKEGAKRVITVGDFVYHYKRAVELAPPQDKPVINTFDDAKDFLDDIIISRVLELEAENLGYGDDKQLKKDVEVYRSNLLREHARSKIEDNIKVTEAEILDYYNKNKEWRHVSFLMCDKKDQAEKAAAELKAGKPWNDVVAQYSIFDQNKDQGGRVPDDFYYTGDNVSRTVYDTEVGKYTPVIETESGDLWMIFRVDEKIPGQTDEYATVKDNIRNSIRSYKANVEMAKYLAKLREEAKIEVNREAHDAVMKGKLTDAKEKYNRSDPPTAISTVGGVPVYFESWYEGMSIQFGMSEAGLEEFKNKEPEEFKKLMDGRLKALEDDALLEFDAVRSGADKEADFIRDLNRFRAGKMVDRIYDEVFVPTIPKITEAEIKEYFDNHQDEFQDLERADIEFVAMPKKEEAEGVRAKMLAGEDFMSAAGEYAQKYIEAMQEQAEPGKEPPRSEMPTVDFFSVPREPSAPDPTAPMGPEGGVSLIVDEIRPRVF